MVTAIDAELDPGDMVGEYRIEGRLGSGGFGTVFRAEHPVIGKKVAIKVLNQQFSANPEMVSRFVAEARAVNQIRHKHIIDIFSFGQLPDGRQYYVMELLDGEPLDRYLKRRGKLTVEQTCAILRGVARALDAAHRAGIAHRDLKPENILVADDDGQPFPKLLDFGIAKLMSAPGKTGHKTQTGTPMGTPYYMSPEQCRGRDVDHRTDVYSFGIMTYQLLTGALPFTGDDFLEICNKQVGEEAPIPSKRVPGLEPRVDEAVAWMLRKDREQRPQTLTIAMDALEGKEGAKSVPPLVDSTTAPPGDSATAATLPHVTPANPSAHTLPTSGPNEMKSFITAETMRPADTRPPKSSNRMWIGIAAACVLVGSGVVFAVTRGGDGPKVTTTLHVDPPAPPPAAPPLPATVEITVEGAEAKAIGPQGDTLGMVPGKLVVPRGDAPYTIRFEQGGFVTATETVIPSADRRLKLAMTPEKPMTAPIDAPAAKKGTTVPKKRDDGLPEY